MALGSFRKLGSLKGGVSGLGGMRPQSPPIAIDFGVSSLKALQVVASEHGLSVVASAEYETPEPLQHQPGPRLKHQIEKLPELIKRGGFRSTRAVCGAPSSMLICKSLRLQTADGISTDALARAELAALTGRETSDLMVRAIETDSKGKGGTEALCLGVARDHIARLMHALKGARLEPVGIHNEIAAIERVFELERPEGAPACPTLIVDLGRGATRAVIMGESGIRFARLIEFGGVHLDQAVANQTKLPPETAARARRAAGSDDETPGSDHDAGVATASEPKVDLPRALETLTDELSMCLRHDRARSAASPVEKILFLGGESQHHGLCASLARSLRLPAQACDPVSRLARVGASGPLADASTPRPGWATALGLTQCPTDL